MTGGRVTALVSAGALLAMLAGCGSEEESEATGPSRETIEVVETDFALDPARVSVDEPGTYTFRAVNNGKTTHALEIEGEGVEAETAEIGPGESAEVKVDLEAGEYELYCPIDAHREQGMDGTVLVGGGAGAGKTDEDQSGSRGDY